MAPERGPAPESAPKGAGCHAPAGYVPRSTLHSDAVAIAVEHWPAFHEQLEMHAGSLPAFVVDELETYASCGDFEQGFLLARCRHCAGPLLVQEPRHLPVVHGSAHVRERSAPTLQHGHIVAICGGAPPGQGKKANPIAVLSEHLASLCRQQPLVKVGGARAARVPTSRWKRTTGSDLGLFVHLHALVTDDCFQAPDDGVQDDDVQQVRFWPTEQLAGDHLLRTLQRLPADLAAHTRSVPCSAPPTDSSVSTSGSPPETEPPMPRSVRSAPWPGIGRREHCGPPHRPSWMSLLARMFRIDVSLCQRCQRPMRVLRAVTYPDETTAALHAARPPPRPSPPGQLALFVA